MSIVYFTVHTLVSVNLPLHDAFQHYLHFSWNLCEELKKFLSSGLMYLLLAHSKAVFVCSSHSADRAQILQQLTLCWNFWLKWVDMYNVIGLEYSGHHDHMLRVLMDGLPHFCLSKMTMGHLNLQNPHPHFCHFWNVNKVKGFCVVFMVSPQEVSSQNFLSLSRCLFSQG